ncbi:hypothetical protein BGV91_gp46 [Haloarcula californiae icosahedral virus 1]|uniref:Uncharacterized protein n=1 Tax=Haloarcula californiae icosahedral virus 1 TaxID=1735722 RepID=A0A1C7A3T4_9VIRU|nr:hypothetical protein BGV91_gp46 [Haloarcula californiae icosahedral virus 1]ALJ99709.1 hypothetical protein SS136_046 [Haloarcula californiae icosahedral virus 1]
MNGPMRCQGCGHVQSPPGAFVFNCPRCQGTNWTPADG